jgi:hypothetical protein
MIINTRLSERVFLNNGSIPAPPAIWVAGNYRPTPSTSKRPGFPGLTMIPSVQHYNSSRGKKTSKPVFQTSRRWAKAFWSHGCQCRYQVRSRFVPVKTSHRLGNTRDHGDTSSGRIVNAPLPHVRERRTKQKNGVNLSNNLRKHRYAHAMGTIILVGSICT